MSKCETCARKRYGYLCDGCIHDPDNKDLYEPMTNSDRLDSMTIEEKAEFLSSIAYGRENPWSNPFREKFCKACPVTKVEIPDYLIPLFLHECDFTDGKCQHGGEIVWWLQQPAEEDDHA